MTRSWLIGLFLGLVVVPSARAELVWDRTSLVSDRGDLAAVLSDPSDPQVAWIASETRVWVTDDGGDAWYLVAQVHGERKTESAAAVREEDPDDRVEMDDVEDDTEFSSDELAPIEDEEEESTARSGRVSSSRAQVASAPVVRLRLVAGQLFLTGDRGLWVIDPAARALGSAIEVRLGRAMSVRDVAQAPWGSVLVATDAGLREVGDIGNSSPARGALGDRDVTCLVVSEGAVIAATDEGLWRVDSTGSTRFGLVGVDQPKDLLALADGYVAMATATEVMLLDPRVGRVTQRWPIARVARLGRARTGRLWAVGVDGAWSWTAAEGSWERHTDGLGDRRLTAVAGTPVGGGEVHLWAVGRGGAWRRVPERVWLSRRRERLSDVAVEEGAPPVWELLDAAHAAHHVSEAYIDTMRVGGKWAFVLPEVRMEYQYRIRREEELVDVPALDRDLLTLVRVYPQGHYLKVMAVWDLRPVIWGFFEGDNPYGALSVADETVRALGTRHQIQSAVVGLYNLWAQRRLSWRDKAPPTPSAAVKAILALQHIEADLHVLTDGQFTSMTTLETILQGGKP